MSNNGDLGTTTSGTGSDMVKTTALAVWLVASAIEREAANQPDLGKLAVAQVVVTRSIEWKQPIHKVINKANFPWGGMKKKMPTVPKKEREHALALARDVLNGRRVMKGTYLYFNTKARGRKFKTPTKLVRIAAHVFY